jgi:hypothetical protein
MLNAYLDALEVSCLPLSASACLFDHIRKRYGCRNLKADQKFSFEVLVGLARALLPGTALASAGRRNISPKRLDRKLGQARTGFLSAHHQKVLSDFKVRGSSKQPTNGTALSTTGMNLDSYDREQTLRARLLNITTNPTTT